ncbi:hypothetical protein SVAN01_05627 [Stagonosporopsis vannaccii]|nr:hypothetical protein SVAN01_05627 [Stagonosporopsis vannaccii]
MPVSIGTASRQRLAFASCIGRLAMHPCRIAPFWAAEAASRQQAWSALAISERTTKDHEHFLVAYNQ